MKNLQPLEYRNQRILTTAQLANAYGTDEKRISENFTNNKDRYAEGKHFYCLSGDQLRAFKEGIPQISGSLKYTSVLYLWTEKGAWLHAKSLNTDRAWEAYERLVDDYFRLQQSILQYHLPTTFQEALRMLADEVEHREQLEIENAQSKQIISEMKPKVSYYDLVLQSESLVSISKIAKDYGMSAKTLNIILHDLKIQFKRGDYWFLYQQYAEMGYTQSKTYAYDENKTKMWTYWTQKGRLFIYDLLKNKKNILPIIEREENDLFEVI